MQQPLIQNDHYINNSNQLQTFEHWPLSERIVDLFVILVIVIGNIIAVASGAYPIAMGVVIIIFALLFSATIIYRPSRHQVVITNNNANDATVTYTQYRFLGFRQSECKTFALKDIGMLVLDTNVSIDCCNPLRCCSSWVGIYATLGLPHPNIPVRIAFEIPIVYNGWSSNALRKCMISCYIESFHRLNRTLRFLLCPPDRYSVTTTVTGGSWAWNMSESLQAQMDDARNSYDNYVAVNPAAVQVQSCRVTKGFEAHRNVYYLHPAVSV